MILNDRPVASRTMRPYPGRVLESGGQYGRNSALTADINVGDQGRQRIGREQGGVPGQHNDRTHRPPIPTQSGDASAARTACPCPAVQPELRFEHRDARFRRRRTSVRAGARRPPVWSFAASPDGISTCPRTGTPRMGWSTLPGRDFIHAPSLAAKNDHQGRPWLSHIGKSIVIAVEMLIGSCRGDLEPNTRTKTCG